MDVFKILIIIIIIIAISIIFTLCIVVEDFIFMDHNSYKTHLAINPFILNHSFLVADTDLQMKTENNLLQIICKNHHELMNNKIKFIEGMTWSKWSTDTKKTNDIAKQIYYYIKNKFAKQNSSIKVIYYKFNRFKYNLNSFDHILLDLDFVFHKKMSLHAAHIKILCVINLVSKVVHMLYIKLVGFIHEDFIYENNANESIEYKSIDYNPVSFDIKDISDDFANEDQLVEYLIYSKIMNDDKIEVDQNNEYYINQKYVKNAFFAENCISKPKTNNIYKNYPYTNDFKLSIKKNLYNVGDVK